VNILITGALGFIGSNLSIDLLKEGHNVFGVDNYRDISISPLDRIKEESGKAFSNFYFCEYSVIEPKLPGSYLPLRFKIDTVVHLAALTSVAHSFVEPRECVSINEGGFASVLQKMQLLQARRIVFASSSAVYGNTAAYYKKEGEEGRVTSPYGLTKWQNEKMAQLIHQHLDISYAGLRFFNVYGPGQKMSKQNSAVIPHMINSEKIVINGDGKATRDFVFIKDACAAIKQAILSNESFICNVGTGRPTSINELAELLAGGKDIVHVQERVGDILNSVASTELMEEKLGWLPVVSLEEGLQFTQKYYADLKRKS